MLIRGGSIVTEGGVLDSADVLIESGVITQIGRGLSESGEVIDAHGMWVLPGVIDPHVHPVQQGVSINHPMLEDFEEASYGAAMGGATTICAYAQRVPGVEILEMIHRQIEFGKKAAYTDFAINALCFAGDDVAEVVTKGTSQLGVRTFKAMLAYHKNGLMLEDDRLLVMMKVAKQNNATVLIHAENGRVIDCMEDHARGFAELDIDVLLDCAPPELEAEGIFKTAMLSSITGARILFVHLTSKIGCETLSWLRNRPEGSLLSIETQPHYALFTNQEVRDRGPLAKVGPVLKTEVDRTAVRDAIANGLVSHLSSDHSPRSIAVKTSKASILDAPYGGISGTEVLLPLAWKLGIHDGLFDVQRVVELTSTNAAKQYGLYPKKGTIRIGSDGDFALVPIDGPTKVITPSNLHMKSDYSLYEGIETAGFPQIVIKGGQVIVQEGSLIRRPHGAYLGKGE
jgi:dihydropyrimidinase